MNTLMETMQVDVMGFEELDVYYKLGYGTEVSHYRQLSNIGEREPREIESNFVEYDESDIEIEYVQWNGEDMPPAFLFFAARNNAFDESTKSVMDLIKEIILEKLNES